MDLSGNTVQLLKEIEKMIDFGIFHELLSTQMLNETFSVIFNHCGFSDNKWRFETVCYPNTYCLKITQNVVFELLQFWHFSPIFVLLKLTCLVTLFVFKLKVFKNSPKLTIFGIFIELLSTQNVNLTSLGMLNETFSVIFNHCVIISYLQWIHFWYVLNPPYYPPK